MEIVAMLTQSLAALADAAAAVATAADTRARNPARTMTLMQINRL
jgi:hypothetical protein